MKYPKKLSTLAAAALRDLKRAEASSKFEVDMSVWFKLYGPDKKCLVCLAGSWLAFSAAGAKTGTTNPMVYDHIETKYLSARDAINALRRGHIVEALIYHAYQHRPELMLKLNGSKELDLRKRMQMKLRQNRIPYNRMMPGYPSSDAISDCFPEEIEAQRKRFHKAFERVIEDLRRAGL